MRTYVDYSHWSNEFEIDATLTLKNDGSFSYSEDWHCYGAGFARSASGTWRQDGDAIFLRCDSAGDGTILEWAVGVEKRAVDSKDSICIDGHFHMSLSEDDSSQTVETPETEAPSVKQNVNENQTESHQQIAKLHFKDGRVLERNLPNALPNALFTQTYYRLIDDRSGQTYVFKARENSANSDSQFIDYYEISTENNDGD